MQTVRSANKDLKTGYPVDGYPVFHVIRRPVDICPAGTGEKILLYSTMQGFRRPGLSMLKKTPHPKVKRCYVYFFAFLRSSSMGRQSRMLYPSLFSLSLATRRGSGFRIWAGSWASTPMMALQPCFAA